MKLKLADLETCEKELGNELRRLTEWGALAKNEMAGANSKFLKLQPANDRRRPRAGKAREARAGRRFTRPWTRPTTSW